MKVATPTRRTKTELRAAYKKIQEAAAFAVGKAEWRLEVDKIVLQIITARGCTDLSAARPSEWLKGAEQATVKCPKCHGTGRYSWGGTVNGKPVKTGSCFACEEKGRQDMDDFFRNRAYWRRAIARAAG